MPTPAGHADDACKALAKDDYKEAERLVGVALAGQPAEAQFHGLRGDIRLAQKRYGDARTNYQRAIERDPEYFAYYLGRGIANSRDGERSAAKSDLNHSVELLPTSVAYNELGRIAEAEGDTAAALRYYQEAGGSGDAAGEAARANALRLDVARQPGRYVQAAVSRDSAGRLLLEVGNPTSATLYGVQVRVDAMDAAGRVRSVTRTLERVQPGTLQRVLVTDQAADFVDARATVLSARAEP
ncbi:MAG: tetratricopeptide repeat protein [Pseudomonadales bacterium]